MSLDALILEAKAEFARRFGRAASWIVAAPGRVNLIGEHTDYNDGFVLPMAIERFVVIAADRSPDTISSPSAHARLYSLTTQSIVEVDLSHPLVPGEPRWANYPRGVMAVFQKRNIALPSFDAVIASNVPLGGGLSSSAALEVAMATLLEEITHHRLDPTEKALLCQWAEHEFAGVPCGIMDQFTSAMARTGHVLFLDCRTRQTEHLPMTDPSLAILIINTNVRHELSGGEYARRREECAQAARGLGVQSLRDATPELLIRQRANLDEIVFRRARHVISEIERTCQAAAAIRAADWPGFGHLMYASHASLRDDFEVSCRELDIVVELGHELGHARGVMGCRMTGGGFGGCAVALVRTEHADAIATYLTENYRARAGRDLSFFVSKPAGGAKVMMAP